MIMKKRRTLKFRIPKVKKKKASDALGGAMENIIKKDLFDLKSKNLILEYEQNENLDINKIDFLIENKKLLEEDYYEKNIVNNE